MWWPFRKKLDDEKSRRMTEELCRAENTLKRTAKRIPSQNVSDEDRLRELVKLGLQNGRHRN